MALKLFASQASVNRLAASLSGEPGAPAAMPMMKATRATIANGSIRVRRRRRRSASVGIELTGER